ncbi:hypothetical protein ACU7RR_004291 [Providencia stuartii]
MSYDEKSIRILKPEEAIDRFDWLKAEELAREYTCPLDWVKRGFEASRRLGISPEHFIDKYVRKLDIPKDIEFETFIFTKPDS